MALETGIGRVGNRPLELRAGRSRRDRIDGTNLLDPALADQPPEQEPAELGRAAYDDDLHVRLFRTDRPEPQRVFANCPPREPGAAAPVDPRAFGQLRQLDLAAEVSAWINELFYQRELEGG